MSSDLLTVTNSTISGNSAGHHGGGIYAYYGDVTVHSSIVAGNTAGKTGPGLRPTSVTLTVTNILIGDNTDTDLAEATTPPAT